jgi:hypothetical protein
MKFSAHHRRTVQAILDGTYTPLDVREFVQFCYVLALPLVRSKILRGKLNLDILGLNEIDVVYDCLADLFRRDSEGMFTHVGSYFASQNLDPAKAHEDEILLALRRLVFNRVHCSLVRLYSEADPVLGKILRNMMLELESSRCFEHRARFGETYLVVRDADPCFDRSPMPFEVLRERFTQVVSVRDSIPAMLGKLHRVLLAEGEFQRAVSFVTAGLLFKEAYAVGAAAEEAEPAAVDQRMDQEDLNRLADSVCGSLAAATRETYVGTGKRTSEVFELYIQTVKEILLGEFGAGPGNGTSYYERLRARMPGLSKSAYSKEHRTVLEYLAKQAKHSLKEELKRA